MPPRSSRAAGSRTRARPLSSKRASRSSRARALGRGGQTRCPRRAVRSARKGLGSALSRRRRHRLRGSNESAARWHPEAAPDLGETLARLGASHDLVLVEGHKQTSLPKLWLLNEGESKPPEDVTEIRRVLPMDGDRVRVAVAEISAADRGGVELAVCTRRGPGGWQFEPDGISETASRARRTSIDRSGSGSVRGGWATRSCSARAPVPEWSLRQPSFADAPGIAGPMAGLMAALRWAPNAAWLMVACDQPLISERAVDWLMEQRRPGRWAILPRLADGPVEPFLAVYEPQALGLLERLARSGKSGPWRIAEEANVVSPAPPEDLVASWRNINTPEEFDRLSG